MRWIHRIWDDFWSRTVNGRLNRKRFVLWLIGYMCVLLVISMCITVLTLAQEGSEAVAFMRLLPIYAVAVILQFLLSLGRMHDLGYSGWQTVAIYVTLIALSVLSNILPPMMAGLLGFLNMFLNVGIFLVFLFRRGTKGPNRYGPDPLENVRR